MIIFATQHFVGCAEDIDSSTVNHVASIKVEVTDKMASDITRADYSGFPSTSFETGDAVGIYVFDGSSYMASNVRFVRQADGSWQSDEDIPYVNGCSYYAYFPYRATAYTPSTSGTADDIDTKFSAFLSDASNYFWQADQSTKERFTYCNLMLSKGTVTSTSDDEVTMKFTMHHKRGLAVFNGAGAASSVFTGTNIPYLNGTDKNFLMKADVETEFTDHEGTYTLEAPEGQYITHSITTMPVYAFSLETGSTSYSIGSDATDRTLTVTSTFAGSYTPFTAVSSNNSWLTAAITGSGTTRTVTISATENTGSARSGTITLSQTDSDQPNIVITVNQSAVTYTFSIASGSSSYSENYNSHSHTLTITSTRNGSAQAFTISPNSSWLSATQTGTGNTKTVTVNAAANSTTSSRSGKITLTQAESGNTLTINYSQTGHTATFEMYSNCPTALYMMETAGSGTLQVTSIYDGSAKDISITESLSWVTTSQSTSGTTKTITITCTANTGNARTGTIYINQATTGNTLTLNVVQAESGHSSATEITMAGLIWCKKNVGASSETDYGKYFSWGNTTGYAKGSGHNFNNTTYNNRTDGNGASIYSTFTSGNAYYDAATADNSRYRTPTRSEYTELAEKTIYWCKYGSTSVKGGVFVDNNNTLFFPATGYYDDTTLNDEGVAGGYWTNSRLYNWNPQFMKIQSAGAEVVITNILYYGRPVRGVRTP